MRIWAALVGCALTTAGCAEGGGGQCPALAPAGEKHPASGVLALERIYAALRASDRVEVGGLDGAAPPGSSVLIAGQAAEVDVHGRFRLELRGAPTSVEVASAAQPSEVFLFRVRDSTVARAKVVGPAWGGAGSVPNDLLFEGERALLVRSGDGALSELPFGHGADDCSRGLRFAEVDGRGSDPWFAAAAGGSVYVSDARLDRVYAIDRQRWAVTSTFADQTSIELSPPLTLACPADVDGDGNLERSVARFRPRAPQALLVMNGRLFVGMSGFLRPHLGDCPAIYLPSVLLSYALDAPGEVTRLRLPCQNPQELRQTAQGQLQVVCSGEIDQPPSGSPVAQTDGAILWIDPMRLEVVRSQPLERFAPASALSQGDVTVVSSLVRAELLLLSGAGLIERRQLNAESVDSVFRLAPGPGGLIFAPSFDTDRLHTIDPRTGVVDGAPFFGPIVVGPGRPLFDGLQIVAPRPGRAGVDFVGPDHLALLGIASKIVPLDTQEVLGP